MDSIEKLNFALTGLFAQLTGLLAHRAIAQSGLVILPHPAVAVLCTTVAAIALEKLVERLATRALSLDSLSRRHLKPFIIPNLWALTTLLTVKTLYPVRFILAVSPVLTPIGATAASLLIAASIFYQTQRICSADTAILLANQAIAAVEVSPESQGESLRIKSTIKVAAADNSSWTWRFNQTCEKVESLFGEDSEKLEDTPGLFNPLPKAVVTDVVCLLKKKQMMILDTNRKDYLEAEEEAGLQHTILALGSILHYHLQYPDKMHLPKAEEEAQKEMPLAQQVEGLEQLGEEAQLGGIANMVGMAKQKSSKKPPRLLLDSRFCGLTPAEHNVFYEERVVRTGQVIRLLSETSRRDMIAIVQQSIMKQMRTFVGMEYVVPKLCTIHLVSVPKEEGKPISWRVSSVYRQLIRNTWTGRKIAESVVYIDQTIQLADGSLETTMKIKPFDFK
jgi:hypothetical protein